jgi:hypothetical protein
MAGFDHKCPYCETVIPVYAAWEHHDYATDFQVECEWCKRRVQVDVRQEPIFATGKPMCNMCCRAEVGGNPYYCDPCHEKLLELSNHNGEATCR